MVEWNAESLINENAIQAMPYEQLEEVMAILEGAGY